MLLWPETVAIYRQKKGDMLNLSTFKKTHTRARNEFRTIAISPCTYQYYLEECKGPGDMKIGSKRVECEIFVFQYLQCNPTLKFSIID